MRIIRTKKIQQNIDYKIIYKNKAIKELKEINNYIKHKLKEDAIAKRTLKRIKDKIENLKYFPFAHKVLRKTNKFEYRKFIIKNYIIVYKINMKEKEIYILHIYNQKLNYTKKSILL